MTETSSSMAERLTLGLCIEPLSRGTGLTLYVLGLFDHAFDLYSSRLLQMTIGLLSALLWDLVPVSPSVGQERFQCRLARRGATNRYIVVAADAL